MATISQLTSKKDPHKRILVVDDNELSLMMMELAIGHLLPDCQIITARNGPAALAELQKQSFDLIMTDYEMPRMNGLDFAQAARQNSQDIPPIILTTAMYSHREIQTKAGSENLAGFLPKPFTLRQLNNILQQDGV